MSLGVVGLVATLHLLPLVSGERGNEFCTKARFHSGGVVGNGGFGFWFRFGSVKNLPFLIGTLGANWQRPHDV